MLDSPELVKFSKKWINHSHIWVNHPQISRTHWVKDLEKTTFRKDLGKTTFGKVWQVLSTQICRYCIWSLLKLFSMGNFNTSQKNKKIMMKYLKEDGMSYSQFVDKLLC